MYFSRLAQANVEQRHKASLRSALFTNGWVQTGLKRKGPAAKKVVVPVQFEVGDILLPVQSGLKAF